MYRFDGHHSGGSSFDSVIRCRPYPQVPVLLQKKKKKKKKRVPVLSLASRKPVRISQSGRAGIRGVTTSHCPSLISSWKEFLGIHIIAFWMGTRDTSKLNLPQRIKKIPLSLVHLVPMLIEGCLLGFAMPQPLFSDVFSVCSVTW